MSISSIGNTLNYFNHYTARVNTQTSQASTTLASSSCITLKMNDEETGQKALTSVGFPNGNTVSVFKADNYSATNPQYIVKHWNKNGDEQEYHINLQEINPEHANYYEMLAYSTSLDISGQTHNAFDNFTNAAYGINGDLQYDSNSMTSKVNYKALVNEFMQLQYSSGNLAGYLSLKQFYDYMNET